LIEDLSVLQSAGAVLVTRASQVGRRYVSAAIQTAVGGIISRVLQGFASVVLARCLRPKEYGVYVLVVGLVGILAGFSSLGQNAALQKFLPQYARRDPKRGGAMLASTVTLVAVVLGGLCTVYFLASPQIAANIYHDPSLTVILRFSAILVLALSALSLATSVAAGLQDFQTYSLAMIVSSGAFLIFGWIGVTLGGLYGALLGQILATFLGVALLGIPAWKIIRTRFPDALRPVIRGPLMRETAEFALPALLAGLLVSPAYWWANTLLARSAGFEKVGLFGMAFGLAQIILLLPSNLSIPAVSFMAEVHSSDRAADFRDLVRANVRVVWLLTLPIASGCALFASPLVSMLFGSRYESASHLVIPMSAVALLIVINNVIGSAIAGAGKMWNGFLLNLFWLACFLAGGTVLIPREGAWGLAATFAGSYLLMAVAVWCYSHVVLRVTFPGLGPLAAVSFVALGTTAALTLLHGALYYLLAVALLIVLLAVEWKWLLGPREQSALQAYLRPFGHNLWVLARRSSAAAGPRPRQAKLAPAGSVDSPRPRPPMGTERQPDTP
jgi:stage V sporulation protein B